MKIPLSNNRFNNNNNNNNKASAAWPKAYEVFAETTGYKMTFQDQVISTRNCKKRILQDPNISNNIYKKMPTEIRKKLTYTRCMSYDRCG